MSLVFAHMTFVPTFGIISYVFLPLLCSSNCRCQGTGTSRAQDLSFPRTNSPYGELSFRRLFVPGNFRSSDYFTRHWLWTQTAVATFRICFVVGLVVFVFQKINWVSLRCVRVIFFLLNKNAKWINVMMPVDKLTLIRSTSSVLCTVTQL